MAALRLRKFGSFEDLELFLRGGIQSGSVPNAGPTSPLGVVYELNTKTLIFTTPATTVTFADTTNAGLSLRQIIDQINANGTFTATCVAKAVKGRIQIVQKTPAAGIVMTGGTACAQLGFPASESGTFYNPPSGAAPRMLSIETFGPSESLMLLVTEE